MVWNEGNTGLYKPNSQSTLYAVAVHLSFARYKSQTFFQTIEIEHLKKKI